jgi:hypothetical protein
MPELSANLVGRECRFLIRLAIAGRIAMADIIDDLMTAHRDCPRGGDLPPLLIRASSEILALRRERDALLRLTVYEAFGRWIAAAPKGVASHPHDLIGWPTREEAVAALIALGIGLGERTPTMEPIGDEGK